MVEINEAIWFYYAQALFLRKKACPMIAPPSLPNFIPTSLPRPVKAPQASGSSLLPVSGTSDSFQISHSSPAGVVAGAIIRPALSGAGAFKADVLADGTIVRQGLMGKEKLGAIDPQGDYTLLNGLRGNVFERKAVEVLGLEQNQHPFALALKAVEKQRAIKGSEMPMIRAQLTAKGINGQGIKVGILDPLEKKGSGWESTNHSWMVKQTIQDPLWGVAPGAIVEDLGEQFENTTLEADNIQALRNFVTGDYVNLFSYMSQKLQTMTQQRDPALRVLNVTYASNRVMNYIDLLQKLNTQDENKSFKFPNLRAVVFGPALYGSKEDQWQAVINCYDAILENSPVVHQAHRQYVEMTRQAAANGLILVAGTSNDHGALPVNAKMKPGSEMNILGKSPYVIRVGAVNTNQTPGNYRNYSVANYSSRGDGYWNPNILAPGSEMGISFSKDADQETVNGTSFSTPFTCGVIAMMLQRNPWMTFDQVKAKLETTATPLPGYQPHEQGAGVLNVVRAVL